MTGLVIEDLIDRLLTAVPEASHRYDQERAWWGEESPGAHVVFGDVLLPFLLERLSAGDDEHILQRVFAFLEDMAESPDERVVNVLTVTVCERLGDEPAVLARARRYMGPRTAQVSARVEQWWGRGEENNGGQNEAQRS